MLLVRLDGFGRLDVVESMGLEELELLSGIVHAGLVGFGASELDPGVGDVATGETH